jgi:hypothetical protein
LAYNSKLGAPHVILGGVAVQKSSMVPRSSPSTGRLDANQYTRREKGDTVVLIDKLESLRQRKTLVSWNISTTGAKQLIPQSLIFFNKGPLHPSFMESTAC